MRLEKIMDIIDEKVPFSLQEEWDNSGLQVRASEEDVTRVLLCLEINERVAEEARRERCQLIISHHPMFFTGIKSIDVAEDRGRTIGKLMTSGISVISCHTSFDKCSGGNNDYLAGLLELSEVGPMLEGPADDGFTRAGILPREMTAEELGDYVAEKLGASRKQVRLAGTRDAVVRRIGLCSGAGAEYIQQAAAWGCEAFITGDVKHHDVQDAASEGLVVVDAGHYNTESFFPDAFIRLFGENGFERVELIKSCENLNPFF